MSGCFNAGISIPDYMNFEHVDFIKRTVLPAAELELLALVGDKKNRLQYEINQCRLLITTSDYFRGLSKCQAEV